MDCAKIMYMQAYTLHLYVYKYACMYNIVYACINYMYLYIKYMYI